MFRSLPLKTIGLTLRLVRAIGSHLIKIQARGSVFYRPPLGISWLQAKGGSKTESPLEGVLSNSTSTEHSGISLIPLSIILDLLTGPAAMQSSGGGGTSNDLDWNDERRRRQKAQENQYVNRPFKRRR